MSTRIKRIFCAVGGVVALVVVTVVLTARWPTPGRLLEGTRVVLEKASYGTNHVSPKAPLEGLYRRLPAKWLQKIQWRPSAGTQITTARPIFMFWLNFSNPGASQPIGYAIVDENGFEAPMVFTGPYTAYWPGGFAKNHVGLARGSGTFPHRSRKFLLRLYQQDGEGKRFRVAEFSIRNEGFENVSGWQPQDLPVAKQTNGLVFSIVKADVGVTPPGAVEAPYNLRSGEWSEFRFQISGPDQSSAGWTINEMIISDATGNRLRVSAEDMGAFNHQFSRLERNEIVCLHRWELWSEEPAWKLSVHFERAGMPGCWIEYLVRPQFLWQTKARSVP